MNNWPLGELSATEFLNEYWQKKPLLIRNAFPDFTPPISADELAGLACEPEVESRLIQQDSQGKHWQLQHGPFDESTFSQLPASHWTLLVQAVDHWVPEAQALLERFRFIPRWRIDDLMVSFATQGGGVGPHYDNYDVFLLQASGRRRWEIGGEYGEHSPRRTDTPVLILPTWEPEQCFTLEPGDILYLPPRIGHNGIALSDDCMTYSVGFRAPSHAEILRSFTDFVGEQLSAEMRYQDADLQLQDNPAQITDSAFAKVRAIFNAYLREPGLLEDWFGQLMTEPKYPQEADAEPDDYTPEQVAQFLQEGGQLKRSEGARFAYRRKQVKNFVLYVNGQSCEVGAHEGDFVRMLCDGERVDQSHIRSTETLAIVTELLNMDALFMPTD